MHGPLLQLNGKLNRTMHHAKHGVLDDDDHRQQINKE